MSLSIPGLGCQRRMVMFAIIGVLVPLSAFAASTSPPGSPQHALDFPLVAANATSSDPQGRALPAPVLRQEGSMFFSSPGAEEAPKVDSPRDTKPVLHVPLGEEREEIPLMEETVVEGAFVDPFDEAADIEVYDPWENFNVTMFNFNYKLDRHVIKPVAKGYDWVMPPDVQDSISNAYYNLTMIGRLLNSLFQGKTERSKIELERFLINSTIGIGGFFDVAKYGFDIEAPPTEDTGQTLAVSGMDQGPYLVLPFLPPLTVRDGVGFIGDIAMNPMNFFVPILPNFAARVGRVANERSRNLETFEGIEESTVDLYGAVRAGYLEKRAKAIRE